MPLLFAHTKPKVHEPSPLGHVADAVVEAAAIIATGCSRADDWLSGLAPQPALAATNALAPAARRQRNPNFSMFISHSFR
jgi:hypothetical protein